MEFFLQTVSQIGSVSEEKRFGRDNKLVFFQNLGASRFIIWYELNNLVKFFSSLLTGLALYYPTGPDPGQRYELSHVDAFFWRYTISDAIYTCI